MVKKRSSMTGGWLPRGGRVKRIREKLRGGEEGNSVHYTSSGNITRGGSD